jgi:hypothetical protein
MGKRTCLRRKRGGVTVFRLPSSSGKRKEKDSLRSQRLSGEENVLHE